MKLYYSAGTCSLSPHIALIEAGLPFTLEKVDLATKITGSGADYKKVTVKGAVPALQLDNGEVLTEGAVITQYIADLKPASNLAPQAGSLARYRLQEWLNFIATEVHKGFSPLFNKDLDSNAKAQLKAKLEQKLAYVEAQLQKSAFIAGDHFTAADGYLFTVLRWSKGQGITLATATTQYMDKIAQRPAVQQAMKAEGITYDSAKN
jgi:glutathione S-transferase